MCCVVLWESVILGCHLIVFEMILLFEEVSQSNVVRSYGSQRVGEVRNAGYTHMPSLMSMNKRVLTCVLCHMGYLPYWVVT